MSCPLSICNEEVDGTPLIRRDVHEHDDVEDTTPPYHPILDDTIDSESVDDVIVSQLLSANERPRCRHHRRCPTFPCLQGGSCWMLLFGLFAWMGFVSSIWSAYSCDLIHVEWNKGGVHLSVTGIGIWRYQKEVSSPSSSGSQYRHKNHISDGNVGKNEICVSYGGDPTNKKMEGFFPSEKRLHVYSILAPSLSFSVLLGLMVIGLAAVACPERFTHPENNESLRRSRLLIAEIITYILAGVTLMISGIFLLAMTYGLLHYSHHTSDALHQSPICNPSYSRCHLGSGGRWALSGALSCCLSALVAFLAPYSMVRSSNRRSCCCG